ncbi:MAG: hypothetical protein SWH61_06790 [Thermodesulfobacteriota bacterium]|nr:hypothetical protein [Thermodesulfobacteriota bacterium]
MQTINELKAELAKVEAALAEARERMPAHSVKPGMMHELIDLEDRRDELAGAINKLEKEKNPSNI